MSNEPVRVAIGTVEFMCTVCGSCWFRRRDVHLVSGTQLFGWAQSDATGLLCTVCGYLHICYNGNLRTWK